MYSLYSLMSWGLYCNSWWSYGLIFDIHKHTQKRLGRIIIWKWCKLKDCWSFQTKEQVMENMNDQPIAITLFLMEYWWITRKFLTFNRCKPVIKPDKIITYLSPLSSKVLCCYGYRHLLSQQLITWSTVVIIIWAPKVFGNLQVHDLAVWKL